MKVIGYLQGWSIANIANVLANIQFSKLTHLIYTDVKPTSAEDPTLASGYDWSYLTDTDMWALQGDNHDLIWFKRMPVKFMKEPDFETGDIRSKVCRRDSCEQGDPSGFYYVIP